MFIKTCFIILRSIPLHKQQLCLNISFPDDSKKEVIFFFSLDRRVNIVTTFHAVGTLANEAEGQIGKAQGSPGRHQAALAW